MRGLIHPDNFTINHTFLHNYLIKQIIISITVLFNLLPLKVNHLKQSEYEELTRERMKTRNTVLRKIGLKFFYKGNDDRFYLYMDRKSREA